MIQILSSAAKRLRAAGVPDPETSARLLLKYAAEASDADLISGDLKLTPGQIAAYEAMISRRMERQPVSRIVGRRSFWNSEFEVSADTLDPRPDTETLVAAALTLAKSPPLCEADPLTICDLGTGSGCILLSLLQEVPLARGIGVDISPAALETAARNAERLGLSERVSWQAGDWTYGEGCHPHMIVANPPYIRSNDIGALEPEVCLHDPRIALDGHSDGLECYRDIARALVRSDFKGPALFEVGLGQASDVRKIFQAAGCEILSPPDVDTRDLAGVERVAIVNFR